MKNFIYLSLIVLLAFSCNKEDNKITIFHAGSLTIPFSTLEKEFEKKHPEYDVQREASGSRKAVRKITDLNRRCEIAASADYSVIDTLLISEQLADYNIKFAVNEMVIAYTGKSKNSDKITSDNWYKLLLTDDVQYGRSDHNADPCGYRTLMTWQLSEKYYKKDGLYKLLNEGCPPKNIRSAEVDLLSLLEANIIDYLFIYKSVAIQHNLKFVNLPDEVNLKKEELKTFYNSAKVKVTGKEPGTFITKVGDPMIYSFTIPKTAENIKGALLFANFLLSEEGRNLLIKSGQPLLENPVFTGNLKAVPESLIKYKK